MAKMAFYETSAGEHIQQAAETMVAMAKRKGEKVTTRFNGVTLVATSDMTPEAVMADYDEKLRIEAEAYRNSAKGKAAAEKTAQHLALMQQTMAEGMARLP